MNLKDAISAIREQIILIVSISLLGVLVGAGFFFAQPVQYTAQSVLYVSSQSGESATSAYQGAQLSQERVVSYVELVRSPRVVSDAISTLNQPTPVDVRAVQVQSWATTNSVIVNLSVTYPDPQLAAALANSISEVFSNLVLEIERPSTPGIPPPVQVRVVQPATDAPTTSTGLKRLVALGGAAGLVLGIAGAVARRQLDTRIRSRAELESISGTANLAEVTLNRSVIERRSPALIRDWADIDETVRYLRSSLKFVNVDSPPTLIQITSSLPAEGKSVLAARLALALNEDGKRTLLVDADLRRPVIGGFFGFYEPVGLTSVLSGRVSLEMAVRTTFAACLNVLPSGPIPPNPGEILGSDQMKMMLSRAASIYDMVIIDSPPVLPVADAIALAPSVDATVYVVKHRSTSAKDISRGLQMIKSTGGHLSGTVLNMVPSGRGSAYDAYTQTDETSKGRRTVEPDVQATHRLRDV